MRPRSLLILALVVGVLLALIYFAEDRVAGTDERAAAAKRLVNVKPEEIEALELEWQGSRVRLERAAKRAEASAGVAEAAQSRPWRIVEPFVHSADDAAVERLLGALTGLEAVRELDGVARQDVGLQPPRGSASWTTASGAGKLEIGGGVPATRDVVVAASGRAAPAVTADAFVDELSRPAGDWRSRTVVAATRDRIERVAIAPAAGEAVVLARSGETLRLECPVSDLADRESRRPPALRPPGAAYRDLPRPAARSRSRGGARRGSRRASNAGNDRAHDHRRIRAAADRDRRRTGSRPACMASRRSGLRDRLDPGRRAGAPGERMAQPELDAVRELADREGARRGGRRRLRAGA